MILISTVVGLVTLYQIIVSKRLSKGRRWLLSIVLALAVATSWVSIIGAPVRLAILAAAFYLGRDLSPNNSSPTSSDANGE
jgi:hypothetical protein